MSFLNWTYGFKTHELREEFIKTYYGEGPAEHLINLLNTIKLGFKMGRGQKKGTILKKDTKAQSTGRGRAQRQVPCPKGYERHHIDGNELNNEPSNIMIVTRKEHMILDGRMKNLDFNKGRPVDSEWLSKMKAAAEKRTRDFHGRFS